MPTAGLEPANPASERAQTHALDLTATGIGHDRSSLHEFLYLKFTSINVAPETMEIVIVIVILFNVM
jgi:hypothetical protein